VARKDPPIRDVSELEAAACRFWPPALKEREQTASVIPALLESQDKFIGLLHVADKSPTAWVDVLGATTDMPANLFLKHLMVLSDLGGEPLRKLHRNLPGFFANGQMRFVWHETEHIHQFGSLDQVRAWTNSSLGVDGRGLLRPRSLSPAIIDIAMLLLHGGASVEANVPGVILEKCTLGTLLGNKRSLDAFIRQGYIQVSRITGGATANAMGQLCQAYVRERLQAALPNWDFSRHTIPGISQNAGRTNMSFDLVAQGRRRHAAPSR